MTYIKVAKPGYNVLTETDPRNFYFNSDYNTLKLRTIISQTVQVTDADFSGLPPFTTTFSVPTSLPVDVTYKPFFFSYITASPYPSGYNMSFLGAGEGLAFLYLDGSNVLQPTILYNNGGTNTITVDFLIYIFANPM